MGFHLLAKKVHDPDLCYIRDLMAVAATIAEITSVQTMRPIVRGVIDRNLLSNKFDEFVENGHYIIEDCYYSDPQKKMNRAADLLRLGNQIPHITSTEKTRIIFSAITCLSKWRFSQSEKTKLLKDNVCPPDSSDVVKDFTVQMYLDVF